MSSRTYSIYESELTIATATTVTIHIPDQAINVIARLSDPTVAFTYSHDAARTTAGDGFPMTAGEAVEFAGPMKKQDLSFQQASGGPLVLHFAWEYPSRR